MSSYFHHLKDKKNILSVVGSGCQIANSLLAGSRNIDTFDISIFPIYFMHLKLASILALSREDFLKFYFSDDREILFSDEMYNKISLYLNGKHKEFWNYLFIYICKMRIMRDLEISLNMIVLILVVKCVILLRKE